MRLEIPGRAELQLPPSDADGISAWRLQIEAPGLWAAPVTVVEGTDQAVKIEMIPAGIVKGRLQALAGEKLPPEVTLTWSSSPRMARPLVSEVTILCPLELEGKEERGERGAFHCQAPADTLDIRVRARGFVTHRFLDLQVPVGGELDLGRLSLRRGASIVGSIVATEGELVRRDVRVNLIPVASAPAMGEAAVERRRRLILETTIDERQAFAFDGVLPGLYDIVAEHPGFAPARTGPVQVMANAETQIRSPLELEPPLSLEVFLAPPHDPDGELWRIDLLVEDRNPNTLTDVAAVEASPDGAARFTDLASGIYVIQVLSSREERMAWQRVELDRTTPPLDIRLDLTSVVGSVHLGDEPLSAELHFGGKTGPERVRLESSDDGAFQGVLPRGGEWKVHVVAQEPRIERSLLVEVSSDDDGEARVRLRLPDTVVRGRVLDPDGKPVDLAVVSMGAVGDFFFGHQRVDPDGQYSFHGVADGPTLLIAEAPGDLTADKVVHLVEGREHEEDLFLREATTLTGTVVSEYGPVPAAHVSAMVRGQPAGLLDQLPSSATDSQGNFELAVPASAPGVDLLIEAPGHALGVFSFGTLPSEPLVLPVDDIAGTVDLRLNQPIQWSELSEAKPALLYRGVPLGPFLLKSWGEGHGVQQETPDRLIVPQLPPGPYAACLVRLPDLLGSNPFSHCVRGFLSPGSVLSLELDGS